MRQALLEPPLKPKIISAPQNLSKISEEPCSQVSNGQVKEDYHIDIDQEETDQQYLVNSFCSHLDRHKFYAQLASQLNVVRGSEEVHGMFAKL